MTRHISTLDLHRYRYGELAEPELARVHSHLDDCDRCQQRLGVQKSERQAFVVQPVPLAIRELTLPSRPANQPVWTRIVALGVVALAAAALGVLALPTESEGISAPEPVEDIRAKGDLPDLEVWIESDRGPRSLRAGESLTSGDKVQLLYRPHGARFVTLAGRDGSGALEVWGTVTPNGDHLQPAPFGLTLDDAPGPQSFYLLGSDQPLDDQQIADAIAGDVDGVHRMEMTLPKK